MRSLLFSVCVLFALLPAATASADHPPTNHGPDGAEIDRGPKPSPRARAASWCGEERNTDDVANELQNGPYDFHAVYAVPSDRPSRLRSVAPVIQRDALDASALIERLYGRAIRFDMGTSCGPQHIDVSVLHLPQTSAELAQLAGTSTGTLDAVSRALDSSGFSVIKQSDTRSQVAARTRNWIVWLDGPAPSGACGQAMLYEDTTRDQSNMNNVGGKVSMIFRRPDNSFCGANSVRHEIGHNLGAVLTAARNGSGGHCTDAYEDTMCTPSAPARDNGQYHELWFDYGNDDYWDPPQGRALPWWTVNLSRFICPDTSCNGVNASAQQPTSTAPPAESGSQSRRRRSVPRLRVRAKRRGSKRWSLLIRARGSGRARISVRCKRNRRMVTVRRHRTALPRTVRSRVSCARRPKVIARVTRGKSRRRATTLRA